MGWEMPPSLGQVLPSPGLTSLSCGHVLENNLWVDLYSRGLDFVLSCVCFLLPWLGMVKALQCQIQVLDLTGSL